MHWCWRIGSGLLLVVLLVGCAAFPLPAAPTASVPSSASPVPTAQPVSSAQPVPLATSPPATPTPAALTLWTSEPADALPVINELASEFAAQQGISMTVAHWPGLTLREELLTTQVLDEPLPHLIWGNEADLAALVLDGLLRPTTLLTPTRFVPAALSSATYEEQVWGVPLTLQEFLLLFSNPALVGAPPATTDELITRSRALHQPPAVVGLAAGWNEPRWLLAWLNGFGGALTTPDGAQATLNTPAMVSALNMQRELLQAATPPDQHAYDQQAALLPAGQAALAIDGLWALPAAPEDWPSIAPLPRVPATGRAAAGALGSSYLMIAATLEPESAAGQQARAFAQFLSVPATQVRLAVALNRLPALQTALDDPLLQAHPLVAAALPQATVASGLPPTRALHCALAAIETQVVLVGAGELPSSEIASAMQRQADDCIQR